MDGKVITYASRLGIVVSLAMLTAGLFSAYIGELHFHMYLLGSGVLVGFVASIASAYVASAAGRMLSRMPKPLLLALAVPPLPLALSPIAALANRIIWAVYIAAFLAPTIPPTLWVTRQVKGSVRLSMIGVTVTKIMAIAYLIVLALASRDVEEIWALLGLLAAYPIPMIYSVSINSFPSTYKMQPLGFLYPLLFALNILSLALLLSGHKLYMLLVLALALALYFPAIGFHRVIRIIVHIGKLKGVPRRVHAYFLEGHFYALLALAYYATLVALQLLNTSVPIPCIIHALALGFIGAHIYVHAPLMVPVVLGVRTARRYTILPYTLLAMASASYCINSILVWALLLLSLALLVYTVWPPSR